MSILEPVLAKKEQSNTSIRYGDRLILKIFRRLHEGVNPDLEIGRFITEANHYPHMFRRWRDSLEFRKGTNAVATVGNLQSWVSNEGDAWNYTLDHLTDYFENCLARSDDARSTWPPAGPLCWIILNQEVPALARETIGPYLTSASLLGQRTGELHVALASDRQDPDFAPEPFTHVLSSFLYQSLRTQRRSRVDAAPRAAHRPCPKKRAPRRGTVATVEEHDSRMLSTGRSTEKITAMRIRCHGDYHLGQLLFTGKDFVIIDFEGEPTRPLAERRAKRSALVDVAGMLRSLDYAAIVASKTGEFRPEDRSRLGAWSQFWVYWVSLVFLNSYFTAAGQAGFLPASKDELKLLLDLYVLQKAIYELTYELNNRPDWVNVPLRGIIEILQPTP